MQIKRFIQYLTFMLVLVITFVATTISAMAVTVTNVPGVEVTVDNNGSVSESSGTVTATVKGSFTTRKTTTITVKNTSGSTATISFNYSVSNHDKSVSTIDDLAGGNTGSYSVLLTAGATKTFTMCSNRFTSNTTATAKLSEFKVEAAAETYNVTVTYTGPGSVTMDGTTISSGSVNSVSSTTGSTFKAVPNSGTKFVAWVDPTNNKLISVTESYEVQPNADTAIKAVFTKADAEALFWVDNKTYLKENLQAALTHVESSSNKVIVLASDGTLTGTHNIPAGVTLLIPCDDTNTVPTTRPAGYFTDATASNDHTNPTAYRTLNMADGAKVTVNGAISVACKQNPVHGNNGAPYGPAGVINMAENSDITINNAAFLYAWGYVIGDGTVTVNSGGTVYECFEVQDYRGGAKTLELEDNSNRVFPFNQYYVQNVHVPMILISGAEVHAVLSINVSVVGVQTVAMPFIGSSGCIFNINSGYVMKDYDESRDRMIFDINGAVSLSSITADIKLDVGFGDTTLNIVSDNYELPIHGGFTINVRSGHTVTVAQNLAILPGAELLVEDTATVKLSSGASVFVYDLNDSGNYTVDISNAGICGELKVHPAVTGYDRHYTRTEADLADAKIEINGTLDASEGYIYTTTGGANICSTGNGEIKVANGNADKTYQLNRSGSAYEIAVATAQLTNGNGGLLAPVAGNYTYINDYWHKGGVCSGGTANCINHAICDICNQAYGKLGNHSYDSVVTPPTCDEEGYTTYTCSICTDSYTNDEVSATGHTTGAEVMEEDAATCTEDGSYDSVVYCSVCNDELSRTSITIPATGHTYDLDSNKCTVCGTESTGIALIGRTLRYVDKISMIHIYNIPNMTADALASQETAGLLMWESKPSAVVYDANNVVSSLSKYTINDTTYYYGESTGIETPDLYKTYYFAAYVKVGEDYIYSDVTAYSPSTYAYNMIEKYSVDENGNETGETSGETYKLCIALLNYISAAQEYFAESKGTTPTTPVNLGLTDDQKVLAKQEINWADNESLEIVEAGVGKKDVTASKSIFTESGNNLLFDQLYGLAVLYETADETVIEKEMGVSDPEVSGTIIWTKNEWDALTNAQDITSTSKEGVPMNYYSEGTSDTTSVWYSLAPMIAPKDMMDTTYYYLGYTTINGTVHYSGVKVYNVEQYIFDILNEKDDNDKLIASESMQNLAKALYYYERAANEALPGDF